MKKELQKALAFLVMWALIFGPMALYVGCKVEMHAHSTKKADWKLTQYSGGQKINEIYCSKTTRFEGMFRCEKTNGMTAYVIGDAILEQIPQSEAPKETEQTEYQ